MISGKQDFILDLGSDWGRTIYLQDGDGVAIDITGASAVMQIRASATGDVIDEISTGSPTGITITGALGKIELAFTAAQTAAFDTTGIKQRTIIEYKDPNGNDIKADGAAAYYALEVTYADNTTDRVIDGYICLKAGGVSA